MSLQFDWRTTVLPLIIGLVLLAIGYTMINVSYGLGTYTLIQLQNATGGTIQPIINPQQLSIIGVVFLIIGIALMGPAIALLIKSMLGALPGAT